jgi:Fe-Mn family superoxide dismutase
MANRREFLKTSLQGTVALGAVSVLPVGMTACKSPKGISEAAALFSTPADQAPLPYSYKSLEPIIDAQTMELHHTKHAAGYAKNLKDAMAAESVSAGTPMEKLLAGISKYSEKMRNNGGGHYNHELFWKCMTPSTGQQPTGRLLAAMESSFNSFGNFKTQFTQAAMTRFGSGWAWLYLDGKNQLQISSTPNQDNPLMDLSPVKGIPLLGLDVWEHAYYLKYQNRRADYVDNWFKIVNWEYVRKRFETVVKG